MLDINDLDERFVKLQPYGDFPVWSKKDLKKEKELEMPTDEMTQSIVNQIIGF